MQDTINSTITKEKVLLMANGPLEFTLYVPRRALDEVWVHSFLEYLWQHGLAYHLGYHPELVTWDDVLNAPMTPLGETSPRPFSTLLADFVRTNRGSLEFFDKELKMLLTIDTDLVHAQRHGDDYSHRKFGTVQVYIERVFLNENTIINEYPLYLIPAYDQVVLAFAHWFDRFCQKLQPEFGIGYDAEHDLVDTSTSMTLSEDEFDLSLQQHQIPILDTWLVEVKLEYVTPKLATAALIDSWLTDPMAIIRRNPDGSLLKTGIPDTYEYATIQYYALLAQESLDKGNWQLAQELYNYAWRVFQANSVSSQNLKWEVTFNSLREQIAKLQGKSANPTK